MKAPPADEFARRISIAGRSEGGKTGGPDSREGTGGICRPGRCRSPLSDEPVSCARMHQPFGRRVPIAAARTVEIADRRFVRIIRFFQSYPEMHRLFRTGNDRAEHRPFGRRLRSVRSVRRSATRSSGTSPTAELRLSAAETAACYLTAFTIASNAFGSFIAKSASTLRLRAIPLALILPMNSE